jgi:hypothetical protein
LAELPADAVRDLGAPPRIEWRIEPVNEVTLRLALVLRDKPANRMPEASFVTFTPEGAADWRYRKLGMWQDPRRTAPRGGGQLQAVESVSAKLPGQVGLTVTPLDTPLVAPLDWPFMVFNKSAPELGAGVRFNLHNNKWGTNFPMWWEGSLVARFLFEVMPG